MKQCPIDFFDPEVQHLAASAGCRLYRMQNDTGEGLISEYPILSGIDLFYNDFHMKDGQNQNKRPMPDTCLLYTSPSPRDGATSRMPSSA